MKLKSVCGEVIKIYRFGNNDLFALIIPIAVYVKFTQSSSRAAYQVRESDGTIHLILAINEMVTPISVGKLLIK